MEDPVVARIERRLGAPGLAERLAGLLGADGGFTRWAARPLEDRKVRLLTSGPGTETLLSLSGGRAARPGRPR